MSRKAQFMKSLISIHADRQFIEFALQTHYMSFNESCQGMQKSIKKMFKICFCNFFIDTKNHL